MEYLNKFIKIQMKIQGKPWLKVSKLVEEQFYPQIGMKYNLKTTKEKIDLLPPKDRHMLNGTDRKSVV